jgi:hypothetical protein
MSPAFTTSRQYQLGINLITQYQGPGDIATAVMWWGIRAYSLASVGTKAIRLRRDSDQSESDFNTVTGGGLDIAAITAFKSTANLFITKLYAQAGSIDLQQTTSANQLGLSLTGGPGGKPTITAASGSTQYLQTASTPSAVSQPYTFSMVAYPVTLGADMNAGGGVGNIGVSVFQNSAAPNTLRLYGGNIQLSVTAADSAWHACNGYVTDPNSIFEVDGTTSSTGDTAFGGVGYNNPPGVYLGTSAGWNGNLAEMGIFSGGSQATLDAFNANQRSFYGF